MLVGFMQDFALCDQQDILIGLPALKLEIFGNLGTEHEEVGGEKGAQQGYVGEAIV